jgi:hypothetical protein
MQMMKIILMLLAVLGSGTVMSDEVFRNTDGSKRIYVRERGASRDALVDESGRVIGYRKKDNDGDRETIYSPDGSKRIYVKERSSSKDALVDESGRVLGYRHHQSDGSSRYTTTDGKTIGYSEDE